MNQWINDPALASEVNQVMTTLGASRAGQWMGGAGDAANEAVFEWRRVA